MFSSWRGRKYETSKFLGVNSSLDLLFSWLKWSSLAWWVVVKDRLSEVRTTNKLPENILRTVILLWLTNRPNAMSHLPLLYHEVCACNQHCGLWIVDMRSQQLHAPEHHCTRTQLISFTSSSSCNSFRQPRVVIRLPHIYLICTWPFIILIIR